MLPALTAQIESLPAVDRRRMAGFDEQIAALVAAAREKGFSEATVGSILAVRERLYAERAVAWKLLVLYGEPLVAIEADADADDATARRLVIDRLWREVRRRVAEVVGTGRGRPPAPDEREPYIDEWVEGLGDRAEDEDVDRAYAAYRDWLDGHADAVEAQAEEDLARFAANDLGGGVLDAVQEAVARYHPVAFAHFDASFDSHLRRGLRQVAAMPGAPTGAKRKPRLERLLTRLFDQAEEVSGDARGRELEALSAFFRVSRGLSDIVARLPGDPDVLGVVDGFRAATGLDRLEAHVLAPATDRLAAAVNERTALPFLNACIPPAKPKGRAATSGTAKSRARAAADHEPIVRPVPGGGARLEFPRAALRDGRWREAVRVRLGEVLDGAMGDLPASATFTSALCRELDAVLIDSGGTDIVKLVLRRLARKLHPDAARTAPDAWRAMPPEDVRLLNRLRDLHRAGRVTIAATTTTVIITVRPSPRGSRG